MVIRGGDRVADVLARDERLVEVFAAAAPVFARLRSRSLRRTMARLVTVEQAARIAGIDAGTLLDRLNARPEGDAGPAGTAAAEPSGDPGGPAPPMPAALRSAPAGRVVDLDVRDDLRAGREPFPRIMAAVAALPAEGGVLRLRATFEPVPLYHVLGRRGLRQWTERLAGDDWRVWFYRDPALEADRGAAGGPAPAEEDVGAGVVVLDVRGLDPPEPMARTLAALEALEPGATLVQLNVRAPQFLLPRLEQMGFTYRVEERQPGLVRVFIQRGAQG